MLNNQPASLPERIVTFVEAASAMGEKAAADEQVRLGVEKKAEALIPGIVDTLAAITVDQGRGPEPLLEGDEKKAAADALKDHARALGVLAKVAAHFQRAQVAPRVQGSPGGPARREKQAGVDSPYTGRRTSQEPPSFTQFQRAVLGN